MKTAKGCKTCAHRDDESAGGAGRCIECMDSRCLSKWKAKAAARRLAVLAVGLAILGQTAGCATSGKIDRTREHMRAVRIVATPGGAMAAIDPTECEALWKALRTDTISTVGCIALDTTLTGLAGYGLYKFGDANGYWGKSSKDNAPAIPPPPGVGHDNNQIVVKGDGNTFILYPVTTGAQ